jgi:hypothetical protein
MTKHQRILPKKTLSISRDFDSAIWRKFNHTHDTCIWFNFLRIVNYRSRDRSRPATTPYYNTQIQLILILFLFQLIKNSGFAIYWPLPEKNILNFNNIDPRAAMSSRLLNLPDPGGDTTLTSRTANACQCQYYQSHSACLWTLAIIGWSALITRNPLGNTRKHVALFTFCCVSFFIYLN